VTVTGAGFGSRERVFAVLLKDGRTVRTVGTPTADAAGRVSTSFVVPNHLRAGEFEVRLTGQRAGEAASASFTLRGR
jgi:hypothetical protein